MLRYDRRDEGQVLVFAAFCMVALMGFLALATDVGMLYREKRLVQTAADAGALAAAAQIGTYTNGTEPAQSAATQNGLTLGSGSGQATVTATVLSGTTSTGYVQVVVTEHTPTIFMGVLNSNYSSMDISATAQASYSLSGNNECMLGLSQTGAAVPNASGVETDGSSNMTWGTTVMSDIATEGNSKISAPGCGVQACGPSTEVSGSGKTAAGLYAWGSGSISALTNSAPSYGTDNSGSTINTTPVIKGCGGDPLASSLPSRPTTGACQDPGWMSSHNAGGQAETISQGTYCNFNTENVSTLTLNPGVYVITNTFSTNSGTKIVGTGVTIYLANGVIANSSNYTYVSGGATPYGVGNGTTMNISAPTTGPYAGIAIWDANSSNSTPDTFTFGGGANSTFSGAIYAPNTNLVLGNGSGTSTLSSNIIANTIMVLGGSTITNNYVSNGNVGGAGTGGVNLAE
jgi:Flp pilus assembly protein TadG